MYTSREELEYNKRIMKRDIILAIIFFGIAIGIFI